MDSEPTVIYKARSAEDANLLKNILAENGIDAQVVTAASSAWAGMGGIFAYAEVIVAEKDVAEARRIAAEFDQHTAIDTSEEVESATTTAAPADWPTCPRCATRRSAICPACRTQGNDFPPADRMPEAGPGEALRPLLLCPECDEPFTPGYLHRCAQCGYQFEAAEDEDHAEAGALREHFSAWVWVVALISVVLMVAAIALLFLSSEPRKPVWTPPENPHGVTHR